MNDTAELTSDRPPLNFSSSVTAEDHWDVNPLARLLAEELAEFWHEGEHLPAEVFLDRHPQLWNQPEAAIQIVYEEVCLREDGGEAVDTFQVLRRFPQWQRQLEALFECHRLLRAESGTPIFPEVGDCFADFRLDAEIGRGAMGRVFLATQPSLADRPVVLKLTPRKGHEHLSLARLQHTHIVPLYSVEDDPGLNVRALCMPYFGGASLARFLEALRQTPAAERSGQWFLDELDRIPSPIPLPDGGPARERLAEYSYAEAVCWMTACLADALQYAHERGLLHLDVKPSNVLLAADGQPMLLDFHLARPPVRPDDPTPDWLGGTPAYMSPEQRAAVNAIRNGERIPTVVEARSDIYSLGMLLFEMLGGNVTEEASRSRPVALFSDVTPGLRAIVTKAIAFNPSSRYASAAEFAVDLRRHLEHQPLKHVSNRSWRERWRKWRRRRPHVLQLRLFVLLALLATAGGAALGVHFYRERVDTATAALTMSQTHLKAGRFDAAIQSARTGLGQIEGVTGQPELKQTLIRQLDLVLQTQLAGEIQRVAQQARFWFVAESIPTTRLAQLVQDAESYWSQRERVLILLKRVDDPRLVRQVKDDLLDLVLFMAYHAAGHATADDVSRREHSLFLVTEAERDLGSHAVLAWERRNRLESLGLLEQAAAADDTFTRLAPATSRDHYLLGRSYLKNQSYREASSHLVRSVHDEPHAFWPNFHQGVCAYHMGRYTEAVSAFRVCIALAPLQGECYFQRGLAYAALQEQRLAVIDFDRAIELDPTLGPAWLRRGLLHAELKNHEHAVDDLEMALDLGEDPTFTHFHLALIQVELNNPAGALKHLQITLQHQPKHAAAKELWRKLDR